MLSDLYGASWGLIHRVTPRGTLGHEKHGNQSTRFEKVLYIS